MRWLINGMSKNDRVLVRTHLSIIVDLIKHLKKLNEIKELDMREFTSTYIDVKRCIYKGAEYLNLNRLSFFKLNGKVDKLSNLILDRECKSKDIDNLIMEIENIKNELK